MSVTGGGRIGSSTPIHQMGGGGLSPTPPLHFIARVLTGDERARAIETIRANHYTRSVPSGKSYYIGYGDAIVVWSIPANMNIARFLLGRKGRVWELSRLWAPDLHEKNLLTRAISAAVRVLRLVENPEVLISYADPNAGHHGGVYRAASWASHGQCDEVRTWRSPSGKIMSRRAFHSGKKSLRKAEVEALGYQELRLPGKFRFVRLCTVEAVIPHTRAGIRRSA